MRLARALLLSSLVALPAPARTAVPPQAPPSAQLRDLAERYFEESLQLNPLAATFIGDHRYDDQLPNDLGPEHRARVHEFRQRFLAEAQRIDAASLPQADRVTLQVLTDELSRAIASERFPSHLMPINQMGGLPQTLAMLGAGSNAQPFRTVDDYERWLRRAQRFPAWADQAIANMREGLARGVTLPRVAASKIVPQLDALLVPRAEDSVFYEPVRSFPAGLSSFDRERLAAVYSATVREQLLPAYRRLRDFLRDEYVPRARDSVAWTALPDGEAWYAERVRSMTTTALTPDEIHQTGLDEVARIRGEMDRVRQQVGFEGDLAAFFHYLQTDPRFFFTSSAEALRAFHDVRQRVDASLPRLFAVFPRADYELREVEPFRAQSAAAGQYQRAAADGSRPGIFYVNTQDLRVNPRYGVETLSLHEAAPGHHFQVAIQQELESLPKFRRFGGYNAYVEGWALYAESLGRELGLFTDPYQYYGRLSDEMLRAMRLVVDTGLHARGWSREQAIRYMRENSSLADADIVAEVERYLVWPGQALGYKLGELEIQGLRRAAERALGAQFDVREFHREVLGDGSVPLDVLRAKLDRWIAARR